MRFPASERRCRGGASCAAQRGRDEQGARADQDVGAPLGLHLSPYFIELCYNVSFVVSYRLYCSQLRAHGAC